MPLSLVLMKEHPIYITGEYIQGNLLVQLPGNVYDSNDETKEVASVMKDVNVRVSLVGASHCRWHDPNDKTNLPYENSRCFQYSQQTLVGSRHETGPVDVAPGSSNVSFVEEGPFGAANVEIPLGKRSYKDCDLIVTLLQYNPRDEHTQPKSRLLEGRVVGKVRIGAVDIVSTSNVSTTIQLSSANTEEGNNSPSNTSSVTIFAKVILAKSHDEILSITIESAVLAKPAPVHVKVYVQIQCFVVGTDETVTINPAVNEGIASYPFEFLVCPDGPGSFQWAGEGRASVGYYVEAYTTRGEASRKNIRVIPMLPIPKPDLLLSFSGSSRQLQLAPRTSNLPFSWPSNHKCTIKLCLARLAYAPGERLDFTGTLVSNASTYPLSVTITLRQHLELLARDPNGKGIRCLRYRRHNMFKDESTSERFRRTCLPGQILCLSKDDQIDIPSLPPSFFGFQKIHDAIRWTYTIDLTTELQTDGNYQAEVSLPIVLCPVPPNVEDAQLDSTVDIERLPTATEQDPWKLREWIVLPQINFSTEVLSFPITATDTKDVYSVTIQGYHATYNSHSMGITYTPLPENS